MMYPLGPELNFKLQRDLRQRTFIFEEMINKMYAYSVRKSRLLELEIDILNDEYDEIQFQIYSTQQINEQKYADKALKMITT